MKEIKTLEDLEAFMLEAKTPPAAADRMRAAFVARQVDEPAASTGHGAPGPAVIQVDEL
jgi:hypothetical protein